MKHFRLIAMIMLLVLCASSACAEETSFTAEDAMQLYSGVYGNVAFALPGAPEMIEENDYPGGWTGSRQLMGNCIGDGAEYQLHAADIAPLVEYFKTNYPDDTEDQQRLQALMNYGMFIPNTYGIDIGDVKPHGSKETGYLWVDLSFTYQDDPKTPYFGRFLLSGTQAVCLIIEECGHTDAVLKALRFVTDAENDELNAQKSLPTFRNLAGLEMTFPAPPMERRAEQDTELLACFAADWSFIQVQFNPVGLEISVSEDELREALITIARDRMLTPYGNASVVDPVVSLPAPHTACLSFSFVNGTSLGEYGQKMLGRLYAGNYGVWYIYTADTETGRAFLSSLRLEDEAAAPAPEPAVEEQGGAADLPGFRSALEKLMTDSALGFSLKPGNFYWSQPVFSGGKWLRAVYSLDSSELGAALISLDSSAPDAAIREVRMLRYASETDKDSWLTFSRLCSLALNGKDEAEPERLAPEGSDLVYDRIILTPSGEIPPLREDIPFPEGQDIADLADSGVTAAMLETRMKALAEETPLTSIGVFDGVRLYSFGDQVGLMVYTDGEDESAGITMIIVYGPEPSSAPYVMYGTMTAFAAMTDMSQEEFVKTSYVLMESPMWHQLADLWPLLCSGDVCAHLQESEAEDSWSPMGFVSGRP